MKLKNTINQFYFDMTINELRLLNANIYRPNVTYNSLLYLDIIAYKKDCTVSFIAQSMNVATSAVTLKVKELIKNGLVFKKQSTTDKRVYYLFVNEEILNEYKIYDSSLESAINKIKSSYTAEQINTFCDILQTVSSYYSKGVINV